MQVLKIKKNGLSSLEKHKDKPIIVVCVAGMSAVQVANDLYKNGFTRVSVLKGGMNSWTSAGLPVAKQRTSYHFRYPLKQVKKE